MPDGHNGILAGHMEQVARLLLGEPSSALSTPDELRCGTHGSMVVEVAGEKGGTWCAHHRGVGCALIGHASTGEALLLGDRRRRRLTEFGRR